MHTQAAVPTADQLSAIENLKQKHKAQDEKEFATDVCRTHGRIKDWVPSVNGKTFLNELSVSQEKQNCDGLEVEKSNKAEKKKYSQQGLEADCETNGEADQFQNREDADGGALWDVFRRKDIPELEEYLRKHFREFRHIYGSPLPQVKRSGQCTSPIMCCANDVEGPCHALVLDVSRLVLNCATISSEI